MARLCALLPLLLATFVCGDESCLEGDDSASLLSLPRQKAAGPDVHFVVTTNAGSFRSLSLRVVESALKHHPWARVVLHSTRAGEVAAFQKLLAPLRDKGYDARAAHFDLRRDCLARLGSLGPAAGAGARRFEARMAGYARAPFWYAQQVNLGRLCLLYFQGGVYLDLDALVIKPLPEGNVAGLEALGHVNNAVLRFERGNAFIKDCLLELLRSFDVRIWGFNGPGLLTRVWKRRRYDERTLRVLPRSAFYLVGWQEAERIFWKLPASDKEVHGYYEVIRNKSSVVHYYFKAGIPRPGVEGLGLKLARENCLLCDRSIF